ncbi:hypothetical protein DEJ46_07385 [Streptomyces venezuelae]|uniref:Uncharacterized protein n=1 Tax=Streptomyces venezuelae TaxID=54571 RepID=A0A5P2B2C3_STRVZ|nr:hypothetical protein DEJ46_07385 [Streptomyces venezuelae]
MSLVSGCTGSVDPDELPGVYRNDGAGAELRLDSDGTFSAVDVVTDGSSDPADFSGRWEWFGDRAGSDFVYLSVDSSGLGPIAGIQLYPSGGNAVEFRPDPDGPPSLRLTRAAAP